MDSRVRTDLQKTVQRLFLDFLLTYQEEGKDDYYYVEQAKGLIEESRKTLYVKVHHLTGVGKCSVSASELQDLLEVITSKYLLVRDWLNQTVPLLLGKFEDKDLQEKATEMRKTNELKFVCAFYDTDEWCGIRELRMEKLGTLVTLQGTVTRTTEVKPELLVGTFNCMMCDREVTGVTQQFKVTQPTVCPSRGCGNRKDWKLNAESRTTRWGDWQRIRIQEGEGEVPAGSMPRTLDVIVRDEAVDRCKPGDKVKITGCLIVVPDVASFMSTTEIKQQMRRNIERRGDSSFGGNDGVRGLKDLQQRDLTYKLAFFGCYVEENSAWGSVGGVTDFDNIRDDKSKIYLSQGEKERFLAISEHVGTDGRRDCLDVCARSIAPAVHGCLDVKKGILLMLVGGIHKNTPEGIKIRGDLNVCLIGDPATAKSALLKWTADFLPRGVFASGKASTAAGLTASVTRDQEAGDEKVIEPGALMLSDNGICCIDEFEQMDPKDQVAIHEAMEQQTITLSKAGIQATLNARASILAACLPKHTYYQATLPLHKNVDITQPIMSRFDLVHVMQDVHDGVSDEQTARHILDLHMMEGERQDATVPLSHVDLQRYIRLARNFKPRIPQESMAALVQKYRLLRSADRAGIRGAFGITVRQLESLVRLSEAVARVHLDEIVRPEYVVQAYELMNNTLKRVEKGDIEINEELEEPVAPEADAGAAPEEAAAQRPRRMKLSYQEYQRIGKQLARHLAEQERIGVSVTEEDLITWYIELVEESITSEAQLFHQQHLVQGIIQRMVTKDRVLVEYMASPDPTKPELRVLVKHRNYIVGDAEVGDAHARDR